MLSFGVEISTSGSTANKYKIDISVIGPIREYIAFISLGDKVKHQKG